jgi:hypothetical protein
VGIGRNGRRIALAKDGDQQIGTTGVRKAGDASIDDDFGPTTAGSLTDAVRRGSHCTRPKNPAGAAGERAIRPVHFQVSHGPVRIVGIAPNDAMGLVYMRVREQGYFLIFRKRLGQNSYRIHIQGGIP